MKSKPGKFSNRDGFVPQENKNTAKALWNMLTEDLLMNDSNVCTCYGNLATGARKPTFKH